LVWLENWLATGFSGMALIVSHDQYFLDSVCTDILELRSTLAGQNKSSLEHFSGDYVTFQNTVEERRIAQARLKVSYEKEKEKLKEFVSREGKKYDNPAHQSQRKMKLKQLEALMAAEVEAVEEDAELVMSFPKPYGVFDENEKLVGLTGAAFAWPGEEALFQDVEFYVAPKARMAILGKNGCGM
jgi:ATPase subunit of ABC transporter with duplicated ATPase domains